MRQQEFLEMVGNFIFSKSEEKDVVEKFCRVFALGGIPLVMYCDSSQPQDLIIEIVDYNEGMIEKFDKISRSIEDHGLDEVWLEMNKK